QWLRDGLGLIERAQDSEAIAASLEGNDGVYFVPALTGLGSPHWDPHARGEPLRELRADGGASANGWLMQFQADILGVPVRVPEIAETTALGAAYLAGVGASLWTVSD